MRAVGKAGARRRLSGAAHACDTISSDSLAEPRHARRPIVRVGWFSRSHLRSACRDALPASAVVRMSGTPMTMRKAIRGHANRVQARARRAAGAKAGRWGRGPDRDPGEESQVAAARTPPGRVPVSRVRGRDFARALSKRGRSPPRANGALYAQAVQDFAGHSGPFSHVSVGSEWLFSGCSARARRDCLTADRPSMNIP